MVFKISDVKVGMRLFYGDHYYLVREVLSNSIIAQRAIDGAYKKFTETDFSGIKLLGFFSSPRSYLAVDRDGTPCIYRSMPTRDSHGHWVCSEPYEDGMIEVGIAISWETMLKIVGKPMFFVDEPVQI